MTEEEAKTKLCPNKFGWDSTEDHENELSGPCEASACMMWQLDEERDENMVLVPCDTGGHCGLMK